MMKKNQGAGGITKPNDASGSDTITNLRGQRLAAARKMGCLFIDSTVPNNDAESITGEVGAGGGRGLVLAGFAVFIRV